MKRYYIYHPSKTNTQKRFRHKSKKNFYKKKVLECIKKGYKKSRRNCNRHHLVNKCRGGKATLQNLLVINIYRHRAWHELFHNLNLLQIIIYLENKINEDIVYDYNWKILFRNLNLKQAIALLKRVKRAKENQT